MASLALLSSDPANGAIDITVKQVVTLTFNQDLRAKSATPATIQVFRSDADLPLIGKVTVSGATASFIPASTLHQNTLYTVKVIGSSAGLGWALQASDGTFLATTIEQSFRTGEERFERLTEITDYDDIERLGFIRENDPLAAQPTGVIEGILSVDSTSPEVFSKAGIAFTAVVIDFDRPIDASTVTTSTVRVTQVPVLGIEDWYASIPTGGTDPRLAIQQGVTLAPPSGTLVVDDDEIRFEIDPAGVVLHNTEFQVTVTTDVLSTDGTSMAQNLSYVFTTEYVPMYTSVAVLRLELGPTIANISDDTLCRMIHLCSIEAWEKTGRAVSLTNPPFVVREWVKCCLILKILAVLRQSTELRAGETKTLGDLTVRYSPTDPKLNMMYRRAVECLEGISLDTSNSSYAAVAVKGSASGTERNDFRMRTWDHLYLNRVPGANLVHNRKDKMLLSQQYAWAGKTLLGSQSQFFISVGHQY